MSRVCPLCAPGSRLSGVRTFTGRDRSYRRAVRRSVIPTGPPLKIVRRTPTQLLHGSNPVTKGRSGSSLLLPLPFFSCCAKRSGRLGGWGATERGKKPCKTRGKNARVDFHKTAGHARVYRAILWTNKVNASRKE